MVVDVFNPERELIRARYSIDYFFDGAADIEFFNFGSKQEVKKILNLHYERSLALQLFLIFIDNEEDTETRFIAGEDFSEYFQSEDIIEYVSNFVFSSPLPKNFNWNFEQIPAKLFPGLFSFVSNLKNFQNAIEAVRENWDNLPIGLFDGNAEIKQMCEDQAIRKGVFKDFARAFRDLSGFGIAWIESQTKLGQFKNSRQILQKWTENFKPDKSEVNIDIDFAKFNEEVWNQKEKTIKKFIPNLDQVLGSIEKQKETISHCLKAGDLFKARKYVEDLIHFQLNHSESVYLAKSLCHLSKIARDIYNFSMQLEWAIRAYDFDSDDGMVHTHIADSYICLGDFDEAFKWLESGKVFGEEEYYLSGMARIFKGQGKLEKALEFYSRGCDEFPESMVVWLGKAEILREMWDLEKALEAYEVVINKFPDEKIPQNGKAQVLKELGELDRAEALFANSIENFGDEYSYHGKAEVKRQKGELDEALAQYLEAIRVHPNSPLIRNGMARIYKEKKEFQRALDSFKMIRSQYPFDSNSWCGVAEIYRDMGRLDEALLEYSEGIEKIKKSPGMLCGHANIHKLLGLYEESLRLYDEAALRFPYDIYILSGRADLLKELGHLDEAVKAYEGIEKLSPRIARVPHAKASVLVAKGNFNEAEKLISIETPKTIDDWIAFHISCMILLKKKKYDEAKNKLDFGFINVPFAEQRNYFQSSLAALSLFQGNYIEAGNYIRDDQTPLANVIQMHYFCATNQVPKAKFSYQKLVTSKNTPVLQSLIYEIGAQYNIAPQKTSISKEDLFHLECQYILLKAA